MQIEPETEAIATLQQQLEAAQRQVVRSAIINRIGRQITSSLSLPVVFQNAVEALHQQLGLAYVAAGIVDPNDPDMLQLLAHAGLHVADVPADYRQPIHEGLVGEAARTRQRVIVNNVADDPRYLRVLQSPTIRAALVAPIVVDGELLGVLNIENSEPFTVDDAAGIEAIADQFGIALVNARRYAEIQLLYETSQRISTAMSVDAVVEAYLEQVAARGRFNCTIAVYERNETGQRTAVLVLGTWSASDGLRVEQLRLPYTSDALDAPLDAGETVTIRDVETDERVSPELRAIQARDGRPALAFIPLLVGGQRTGLVILSYRQPYSWREGELRRYQVTAAQLAIAIESRRQHLLLAQNGRQLAVLEERRRLARELHDSVTQSLFSMSLLTQVLPDLWELNQEEARAGLRQVRDLTRSALGEMRALLFELRPTALGQQTLVDALRDYAATFQQRTNLTVRLVVQGTPPRSPLVEEALFRIAQEALANIARHAHAHHITLTLHGGPPLRLSIGDDGVGFEAEAVASGRFGLVSMRERASAIGAGLRIQSVAGRGTEIVVEWPAPTETGKA
ncbi:MAG: GAF domain-containing sensor histidine kinase [Chloroflexaceae bacterium]|jgi:signal transduction histidine kinase|nr:GAF domain-containing sensor histidine kinase [Chloroflexaceae bacterium]